MFVWRKHKLSYSIHKTTKYIKNIDKFHKIPPSHLVYFFFIIQNKLIRIETFYRWLISFPNYYIHSYGINWKMTPNCWYTKKRILKWKMRNLLFEEILIKIHENGGKTIKIRKFIQKLVKKKLEEFACPSFCFTPTCAFSIVLFYNA